MSDREGHGHKAVLYKSHFPPLRHSFSQRHHCIHRLINHVYYKGQLLCYSLPHDNYIRFFVGRSSYSSGRIKRKWSQPDCIIAKIRPVADLRGLPGTRAHTAETKFLHFHAVFGKIGQIVGWRHPSGWRTPTGNLGSPTAIILFIGRSTIMSEIYVSITLSSNLTTKLIWLKQKLKV